MSLYEQVTVFKSFIMDVYKNKFVCFRFQTILQKFELFSNPTNLYFIYSFYRYYIWFNMFPLRFYSIRQTISPQIRFLMDLKWILFCFPTIWFLLLFHPQNLRHYVLWKACKAVWPYFT